MHSSHFYNNSLTQKKRKEKEKEKEKGSTKDLWSILVLYICCTPAPLELKTCTSQTVKNPWKRREWVCVLHNLTVTQHKTTGGLKIPAYFRTRTAHPPLYITCSLSLSHPIQKNHKQNNIAKSQTLFLFVCACVCVSANSLNLERDTHFLDQISAVGLSL